jgi:hypothetical protein
VGSLEEWNEAWGGAEVAQRVNEAALTISDYLHTNSSIAAHAPDLLVFLEHPDMWATRWSVDDGDGLTVVYEGDDITDGLLKEAGRLGLCEADGVTTIRKLTLHIRLVCIDAPEWFQPFLVSKPLLTYLLTVLGWLVRISKAYYADETSRIFAEVTIGPSRMRRFRAMQQAGLDFFTEEQGPWASRSPPVRQEVPLHMLLLASGVVNLMPSFLFCCSVMDLHLTIDLYGISRASALARNRVLSDAEGASAAEQGGDHDTRHLWHLSNAWHAMVKTDAFTHFKVFFPASPSEPAPRTLEDYKIALADWHKDGFNIHLSEPSSRPTQGGARLFDRAEVRACVTRMEGGGMLSEETLRGESGQAARDYVWWRYDSDWGRFPEKMLWGKPHIAKKAWHASTRQCQ